MATNCGHDESCARSLVELRDDGEAAELESEQGDVATELGEGEYFAGAGDLLDQTVEAQPLEFSAQLGSSVNRYVEYSLREAKSALDELLTDKAALEAISDAGALLIEAFERRGRVFSCGNGGSMCDAMHFAEELTGRYRRDRAALPAIAISDAGYLSCVGNDLGYEQVFSRYLEAHGRTGDCLVALSTSGSSKNVLRAAEVAQSMGVQVIGLTGRRDAALARLCAIHICTPACQFADRVQELHIKVLHILVELVERHFFPGNYAGA